MKPIEGDGAGEIAAAHGEAHVEPREKHELERGLREPTPPSADDVAPAAAPENPATTQADPPGVAAGTAPAGELRPESGGARPGVTWLDRATILVGAVTVVLTVWLLVTTYDYYPWVRDSLNGVWELTVVLVVLTVGGLGVARSPNKLTPRKRFAVLSVASFVLAFLAAMFERRTVTCRDGDTVSYDDGMLPDVSVSRQCVDGKVRIGGFGIEHLRVKTTGSERRIACSRESCTVAPVRLGIPSSSMTDAFKAVLAANLDDLPIEIVEIEYTADPQTPCSGLVSGKPRERLDLVILDEPWLRVCRPYLEELRPEELPDLAMCTGDATCPRFRDHAWQGLSEDGAAFVAVPVAANKLIAWVRPGVTKRVCPDANDLAPCLEEIKRWNRQRDPDRQLDIGVRGDSASSRVELLLWAMARDGCHVGADRDGSVWFPERARRAFAWLTSTKGGLHVQGFCPVPDAGQDARRIAGWDAARLRTELIRGEIDVALGWPSWAASDAHFKGLARDLYAWELGAPVSGFWYAAVPRTSVAPERGVQFPLRQDLVLLVNKLVGDQVQDALDELHVIPAVKRSPDSQLAYGMSTAWSRPLLASWPHIEEEIDLFIADLCAGKATARESRHVRFDIPDEDACFDRPWKPESTARRPASPAR